MIDSRQRSWRSLQSMWLPKSQLLRAMLSLRADPEFTRRVGAAKTMLWVAQSSQAKKTRAERVLCPSELRRLSRTRVVSSWPTEALVSCQCLSSANRSKLINEPVKWILRWCKHRGKVNQRGRSSQSHSRETCWTCKTASSSTRIWGLSRALSMLLQAWPLPSSYRKTTRCISIEWRQCKSLIVVDSQSLSISTSPQVRERQIVFSWNRPLKSRSKIRTIRKQSQKLKMWTLWAKKRVRKVRRPRQRESWSKRTLSWGQSQPRTETS